jgi:hypothetical protein
MYRLWFTVWFHLLPSFLGFPPFPFLGFPPLGFPPFLGFTPPLDFCGSGSSEKGAGVFEVGFLDAESLGAESLGGVLGETFELGGGFGLRLAPASVHSTETDWPLGWYITPT